MIYRSPLTHAMVKVASKAAEETYAPDILAHELGHARLHGDSPWLMPARTAAPLAGQVANLATGSALGLAGHLVPLTDEAYASTKAMRTLKEWDVPEEDRRAARKRLGLGFSSYAVGPAVDAGLTIGGIASGSTAMRVAAPFAGRLAHAATAPSIVGAMDRIPIKGVSKARARALAKRTRPGTDVHFAKKPLPDRGGFMSRPIVEPTEKELRRSKIRKELGAFIGRKASGKLLRKGGVVVGPSK
jgi:hypothetical protein